MSSKIRPVTGALSVILVGVYSWIMMATNGEAASWAWLVLVVAIALLIIAARSERPATTER